MKQKVNAQSEIDLLIQERLEALLVKKGISRRQLADRINIKEGYLGKMMRGERPWKVSYLKQVADGLDVPVEAILSDTFQLPVVAEIGDDKDQVPRDYHQVTFDYHAVVLPKKDRSYVPYPELPKSLAAKTYVIKVTGTALLEDLHLYPGSHLYITRGLGNTHTLKDGDLAVWLDGSHRGHICRIQRDDPTYIVFQSSYAPLSPHEEGMKVKMAETVSGIDVVVAIVLRPDLLFLE